MRHSFDTFKETAASVMGNADFRLIWYVGSLAEFGRRFELLVLVWLILQVTDGYFQLGLMVVFNNIVRPFVFSLRRLHCRPFQPPQRAPGGPRA